MLAVVIDRRVVRADAIECAVFQAAGKRVAIALAAKRRLETAVGVEVAEVHVTEVQMVNADVAAHRQAFALRRAQHLDTTGGR